MGLCAWGEGVTERVRNGIEKEEKWGGYGDGNEERDGGQAERERGSHRLAEDTPEVEVAVNATVRFPGSRLGGQYTQ